jgi:hypothetical protein
MDKAAAAFALGVFVLLALFWRQITSLAEVSVGALTQSMVVVSMFVIGMSIYLGNRGR